MSAPTDAVVIGLGGNVGTEADIRRRFGDAREALTALSATGPTGVRSARLYRTAPIGPAQPPFLNTAVRIVLDGTQPGELIATVLEIEHLLGRQRAHETRWGPRPLDLDILVWGARIVRTPELDVPHPRLTERRFALAPLVDLLGAAFVIPGAGTAGDALGRVTAQACEELAETW